MAGPRKPETIRLHPARRQVFQWHFREDLSIRILKQRMDQLSLELVNITGEDFTASERAWEGRIYYWNRRSPKRWNIKKRQRGPDVPIPADIVDVPYWREWGVDVEDWAKWKNCLLSKCNLLEVPPKPSTAVSSMTHNLNQAPARDLAYWKAQEGQKWGLSISSESETSRVPSLCSGTSRSTGSFSHGSLPIHAYPQDPKAKNAGSTSWPDTTSGLRMNMYQPQLAHSGNYNDQGALCDETFLAVTPAGAPAIHQAGFNYDVHQNMTLSSHARHGADMSYNSPHSHDPGLAIARPLQVDQRLLYMPPEQEDVAHQMINYNHNDNTNGLMAPPPLDASSAASTLRLPPRVTVQHTMRLYGGYVPQEGFYDTS